MSGSHWRAARLLRHSALDSLELAMFLLFMGVNFVHKSEYEAAPSEAGENP